MRIKKPFLLALAVLLITAAARSGGDSRPPSAGAQLLNDRSQQIVGADLLNAPGFVTPAGLAGRGQVVAVADSGIDKGSAEDIHPDLASTPGKKPKIIMLKSWAGRQAADDPVGHGTHMAGTIAGSGGQSGGKFRGLAPEASIYFQGILDRNGKVSPPPDIESLFLPAYQAGARIHVNAWGSGDNSYSGNAMRTDAFVRRHPDLLVIFGSGNSGPGKNSLTSEANSKNSLVVGSSVSPRPALDFLPGGTLDTAGFSSRGPAGDGRIKPDLLAPGTSIISTRSSLVRGNLPGFPQYSWMQGSSMSSAVAAGAAALLREYMQREMAIPDPAAASIKAALINGAGTAGAGPSVDGFGVLDLAGTVLALKEKTMLLGEERQGLPEGGVNKYRFKVENPGPPLKITLAWTDPAGDPSSPKALVNNLDLLVTAPDGKTYYGNDFLGRAPDEVNNVEQVYIKSPPPGEYIIEVRAVSVKASAGPGGSAPRQDYSLVYGQPLATGIVEGSGPGGVLSLFGGGRVNLSGKSVHYMFNGQTVGRLNPDPGYRVYFSGDSVYVAGRLWRPESVQAREGIGGRVWFEVDRDASEGGYYQSPESGKGLMVNGVYRENISGLPPGVGLEAALDGATQTLRRLATGFITASGNVARVDQGKNGEISSMELFNDRNEYRVSPGAGYIYNDNFQGTDPLEIAFGSGNLDGLRKIVPGQQVTLVMPPVSRQASAILVNRNIVSGYVTGVSPGESRISIGQNPALRIFAGAGVQKDRAASSLKNVTPGDYAVAMLLPGTGDILGLAVYSNVVYGQVLFTSDRDKTVYINDFQKRFQVYSLSAGTEVRRWGLAADASTLTSGTWVRVTLSPDGSQVWRMDVVDLLEDEKKSLVAVDGPYVTVSGGEKYLLSGTFTEITKEGLPVTAEDLRPGEKITVVSLLAPAPYNKVPVAIRARAPENAGKPVFMAAVLEEGGQFTLSGYTSGDRLYVWHQNGMREDVPVRKGGGSFSHPLRFVENESVIKVVTVDSASGAVAGRTIARSEVARRDFTDIAGHWAEGVITSTAAAGIMAGYGDGTFRPDRPITRVELDIIRAVLTESRVPGKGPNPFGNTGYSNDTITRAGFILFIKNFFRDGVKVPDNYTMPFRDCAAATREEKEAVAWGYYRGIIKGRSPGIFDPDAPLTRAEAAAVLQGILRSAQ